jgi:BASS family bile acid:Na+ symporter
VHVITDYLLPVLLAGVMLAMGLTLTLTDFRRVFAAPRPIIVGLTSLLLFVPLLGLTVASLAPIEPALALGVFLISTCPGGTFSNLLTAYGKGDVALSISMTAIGCIAYVVTGPFWIDYGVRTFLGEASPVSLPRAQTFFELFLILVLPTALGMMLRVKLAPASRKRLLSVTKNVSASGVVAIFLYLFVTNYRTLDWNVAPAVIALNLLTVGGGALAALLAKASPRQRIAVVCEHAIRQEGTAIFLVAASLRVPTAALPLMLNSFVGAAVALAIIWGLAAVGERL